MILNLIQYMVIFFRARVVTGPGSPAWATMGTDAVRG
jgi:hypothetical protein